MHVIEKAPTKIMKNQGKNKNRNKFDSHELIHFTAELIVPIYFLYFTDQYMGFYFSKRFFSGLIIKGLRIIYKTLAFFLYLSSIIYADVIEPIETFSMVNKINLWKK